jgi:hypothetical protein
MTEQLPDSEMQLLVADAVRYRFLRDVVPSIINEIHQSDANYDWNNYAGFESIFYSNKGSALVLHGNDLDEAIDAELGILVDREIAEKIKETP